MMNTDGCWAMLLLELDKQLGSVGEHVKAGQTERTVRVRVM